eukprot:tig00000248_g21771.t1
MSNAKFKAAAAQVAAAAKVDVADVVLAAANRDPNLHPGTDKEWVAPDGTKTGIFIRDPGNTVSPVFVSHVEHYLKQLWNNMVGNKLIKTIATTNSPLAQTKGYKMIIVRPSIMAIKGTLDQHSKADWKPVLDVAEAIKNMPATTAGADLQRAKDTLLSAWNGVMDKYADCRGDANLTASKNLKPESKCLIPTIHDFLGHHSSDNMSKLQHFAAQIHRFLDNTPQLFLNMWSEGSATPMNVDVDAASTPGQGAPSVLVFHASMSDMPWVPHMPNPNPKVATRGRSNDVWKPPIFDEDVQEAPPVAKTTFPAYLGLGHELLHGLHRLQGIQPPDPHTAMKATHPWNSAIGSVMDQMRHCSVNLKTFETGLRLRLNGDWFPFRALEEWKTVGLYPNIGEPSPQETAPACFDRGVDTCALTENNLRAAHTFDTGERVDFRAAYTGLPNCELDSDVLELDAGGDDVSDPEEVAGVTPYAAAACGDDCGCGCGCGGAATAAGFEDGAGEAVEEGSAGASALDAFAEAAAGGAAGPPWGLEGDRELGHGALL